MKNRQGCHAVRFAVSIISALTCLCLGATPAYRVSLEGGAPDGAWTEKSSFPEAVRMCDDCPDAVIELLADDDSTLTQEVYLGVEYGKTAKTAKPKLTIRSDSRGETRYTLKRAAAAALLRLSQSSGCTEMTVVFTNIVLDGGAKWANPDNLQSTDQAEGGIGCSSKYAFLISGNAARLHFASGTVLQNFFPGRNSGSAVINYYGDTSGHVYFEPGAVIRDCRGGSVVVDPKNSGSFFADGATFTHCGATAHGLFLWYDTNAQTGRRVFHDTVITNNVVPGSGTLTGLGVVEVRNAAVVELTGNTVIKDNFYPNGTTPANFFAWGDTNLKVSAPLTSPAGSIGFKYKEQSAAVDKKFGEVTDASYTDGTPFFWDGNSGDNVYCGAVSGGDLVWRSNKIAYVPHPWEGYYDGKPHSAYVEIVQPPTGGVAYYRLTDDAEWTTDLPTRTEVGSDEYKVKITAPGIADVFTTVMLSVWDPSYDPVNKYRMRVDGGSWTLYKGLSDVGDALWSLCATDNGQVIEVELMGNDTTSFTNRVVLGNYEKSSGPARTLTFRSNSDSAQRYTLTCASADAYFYIGLPKNDGNSITFTNIVLDGGAKWTSATDFKSLDQDAGGIVQNYEMFYINKQCLHFGADVILRNCRCNGSGAGNLITPFGASSVLMDPGTKIVDCRGGCLVKCNETGYTLHLDGVTITRCSAKTHALFLLFENSTPKGDVVFNDTVITNNVVDGSGGQTGVGVIELRNKAQAVFSGKTIIRDNLWKDGTTPANVFTWTATNITATATLRADEGAEVRVRSLQPMGLGDPFGIAPAGLPAKSARSFVNDVNPKLVGCVEDGVLKWFKRVKGLIVIVR